MMGDKKMYNDLFSIGPLTVHSYGLLISIGLLLALWLSCRRATKRGLNSDYCYGIVFCSAIFGFMSSKLLFIIVEWKSFIANPIEMLSTSGFVVFGGITGGILANFIYLKIKKADFVAYLDMVLPTVALAQAIGRVGCFMAGCCYGRHTDAWYGIAFKHSMYAPNNVKLIPTQLIMALGDLLIFIILLLLEKKFTYRGFISGMYLILYSAGRFVVEFLRNDSRGNVGVLSTSQFYGIFMFVIGVVVIICSLRFGKNPKIEVEEGYEKIQ